MAGKKVHKVEASQTLYAIARMYNVTAEDIKKWNNLASNEISLGQELIVSGEGAQTGTTTPTASSTDTQATAKAESASARTNDAGQKVHLVGASQGLFSIARMYNLPIEDLRRWNGLSNDNLKVGQELLLEEPRQAAAPTTTSVQTAPVQPVAQNAAEPAKSKETEKKESVEDIFIEEPETAPVAAQTTKTKPENIKPEKAAPRKEEKAVERPVENTSYTVANTSGYVKKVESGLAEVIAGNSNSDMFLALHRTAPVGTIMQIRNQMNDLSVFVKVVGKLPDTGANDKVVVKISQKAFERLAAVDKRFRVELSYMP
jgi:LysM repeat protein